MVINNNDFLLSIVIEHNAEGTACLPFVISFNVNESLSCALVSKNCHSRKEVAITEQALNNIVGINAVTEERTCLAILRFLAHSWPRDVDAIKVWHISHTFTICWEL